MANHPFTLSWNSVMRKEDSWSQSYRTMPERFSRRQRDADGHISATG